jgi:hypothetical protein
MTGPYFWTVNTSDALLETASETITLFKHNPTCLEYYRVSNSLSPHTNNITSCDSVIQELQATTITTLSCESAICKGLLMP